MKDTQCQMLFFQRVLWECSVRKKILLTNAAGGANPSYKPGDFMMITDHITTGVPSPLIGPNMDELGTRFPDMSEVYSRRLQDVIRKCAKECDIKLQEGVYVQFTGPNYETPAEVRLAQRWGWRCSWNEHRMRSYGCPTHGNGNLWNFLHHKYGSRNFPKRA